MDIVGGGDRKADNEQHRWTYLHIVIEREREEAFAMTIKQL